MRVAITGGTGFIGQALARLLLARGVSVAVPSRDVSRVRRAFAGQVTGLAWDGRDPAPLADFFDADPLPCALVNLAGENLAAGRWTPSRRLAILESRVAAGRAVAEATARARHKPAVVIQGSAVGYYGKRPSADGRILDESAPSGDGFLAEVCRAWEAASAGVAEAGVRWVAARTGLVLGPGGALARMLPPFRMFLGGPPGPGGQWVPWVALADAAAALAFLLEHPRASGPVNLVGPEPCTMAALCRALGRALRRPSWLPVPAPLLRLALGDMAEETILASQRAVPGRLLALGFTFGYAGLDAALAAALEGERRGGSGQAHG